MLLSKNGHMMLKFTEEILASRRKKFILNLKCKSICCGALDFQDLFFVCGLKVINLLPSRSDFMDMLLDV